MKRDHECRLCRRTAGEIVDYWGSAPCLHSLDEPHKDCLEDYIREQAIAKEAAKRHAKSE
jgi:hypothetical protein